MFFYGNLLLIPDNKAVEFLTLMAKLMRVRRSKGLTS